MAPEMTAAATDLSSSQHPMVPRPFRVVRYRRELKDTFTVFLEPEDGTREFLFQPGQFNMIYLPGAGEVPISISGDPAKPGQLVHTIRAVGNVTNLLHNSRPGDIVGIRGPFGTPWPVTAAEGLDIVIVAGGLGLAPLRPVIYQVLANRGRYGNFELVYGARSPQEMLFRRELERWRGRFDMRVHVTLDRAGPEWRGNVGVVTDLISHARFDPHADRGPGVRSRSNDAFQHSGTDPFGPETERHLCISGAQHAMRSRPVRPLSARPCLRLQGRPGVLVRSGEQMV